MSGTVALWFNNYSLCLVNLLKTCNVQFAYHAAKNGGSYPRAIKEAVIDHRSVDAGKNRTDPDPSFIGLV